MWKYLHVVATPGSVDVHLTDFAAYACFGDFSSTSSHRLPAFSSGLRAFIRASCVCLRGNSWFSLSWKAFLTSLFVRSGNFQTNQWRLERTTPNSTVQTLRGKWVYAEQPVALIVISFISRFKGSCVVCLSVWRPWMVAIVGLALRFVGR